MALWRLNIKTEAHAGFDPRAYCIANNLAAVGWGVWPEDGQAPRDLEHYLEAGKAEYVGQGGWWPAINAIACRMAEGDLCWTRDWSGIYYLGRIAGPWLYLHGEEFDKHDLHNARRCDWHKVGLLDDVPGAVERSFGPARTVQQVDDATAAAYSLHIYAELAGEPLPDKLSPPDLFSLLSPLDHEDLAGLYLQAEKGYLLVPSTIKASTAAYEWVMYGPTGEQAVLQVKSGGASIDASSFAKLACRVFLIAADGMLGSALPENVTPIGRDDLLAFARRRREIMPRRILKCMEWCGL